MEKSFQPGSISPKNIQESLKYIELLTENYKRRRISTEDYIKRVNENLLKLTTKDIYLESIKNIVPVEQKNT